MSKRHRRAVAAATAGCRAARSCPCRPTGRPSPGRRARSVEVADRLPTSRRRRFLSLLASNSWRWRGVARSRRAPFCAHRGSGRSGPADGRGAVDSVIGAMRIHGGNVARVAFERNPHYNAGLSSKADRPDSRGGERDGDADATGGQSEGRQRQDDAGHQRRRLARGGASSVSCWPTSIRCVRRPNGWRAGRRCFRRSPAWTPDAGKDELKEHNPHWLVHRYARGPARRERCAMRCAAPTFCWCRCRRARSIWPQPSISSIRSANTRRSRRAISRSAWSRCASIRAPTARASSRNSSSAFDFPLVAHLRATQVYVHCARDGLTIVRPAALSRRAGSGAVATADAVDRTPRRGEKRLAIRSPV